MFTVKRASNDSSAQLELYFTDIIINSVLTKVKLLQHDACMWCCKCCCRQLADSEFMSSTHARPAVAPAVDRLSSRAYSLSSSPTSSYHCNAASSVSVVNGSATPFYSTSNHISDLTQVTYSLTHVSWFVREDRFLQHNWSLSYHKHKYCFGAIKRWWGIGFYYGGSTFSFAETSWLAGNRRSLLNQSISDYDELCVNIKIHIVSAVLFWFSVYFFIASAWVLKTMESYSADLHYISWELCASLLVWRMRSGENHSNTTEKFKFKTGRVLVQGQDVMVAEEFVYLGCLCTVRKSVITVSVRTLVEALIASRLDYCNSVFHWISADDLQSLLSVLNVDAQLIMWKRKSEHMTATHFVTTHTGCLFISE